MKIFSIPSAAVLLIGISAFDAYIYHPCTANLLTDL
jgi:hypothetical protein